jgi:hypothetical protein
VEVWKFGTHERASRLTPLMLFAAMLGNVAALRYNTPRLQGAAAGYGVTAAKTLLVTRALFRSDTVGETMSFGYSDSDRGFNNAADGANPVELDSASANGVGTLATLVANTLYDVSVYYEVPAGKFPRIVLPIAVANVYVQLFGHEV